MLLIQILDYSCLHNLFPFLTAHAELQEGDVRLAGGMNNVGRVEVYLSGDWGTVCDDRWDLNDAKVVCRQLGYSGAVSVSTSVSGGSGPIHLDEVSCTGSEARLANCSHDGIGIHDCTHSEDVGVVCESQCEAGQLINVVSVTYAMYILQPSPPSSLLAVNCLHMTVVCT